jgi:hypothetical protein
LADALKKQDRFQEAMSAAVDCFLEDELHPSVAVTAWHRIMAKLDADDKSSAIPVKYVHR